MPLFIDFLQSKNPLLPKFFSDARDAMLTKTIDRYVNAFDDMEKPVSVVADLNKLIADYLYLVKTSKLDPASLLDPASRDASNSIDFEKVRLRFEDIQRGTEFANKILMISCYELLTPDGNIRPEIFSAFKLDEIYAQIEHGVLKPKYGSYAETLSLFINQDLDHAVHHSFYASESEPDEIKSNEIKSEEIKIESKVIPTTAQITSEPILQVIKNELIKGFFSQINMEIIKVVGDTMAVWIMEKEENVYILQHLNDLLNMRPRYALNVQNTINHYQEINSMISLADLEFAQKILYDSMLYKITDVRSFIQTKQLEIPGNIQQLLREFPDSNDFKAFKMVMSAALYELEGEIIKTKEADEAKVANLFEVLEKETKILEQQIKSQPSTFFKPYPVAQLTVITDSLDFLKSIHRNIVRDQLLEPEEQKEYKITPPNS